MPTQKILQKGPRKKLRLIHLILFSIVFVILVFLIWSVFSGSDSNQDATEHIGNESDNQTFPELQPASPANMTSEPKPARIVPIDGVYADGQPKRADALARGADNGPQPTELNKLNEEQQLTHAKNELAARLAITIDDIDSQGLQRVSWRSSATGCPKPGRNYMQVIVPGVLIKLQANGEIYRYHATSNGRPFYCPAGQAETPAPSADGTLE